MSTPSYAFDGSIPAYYDQFLGPLLFEPYAVDLVSRIGLDKPSSIMELACGTGRVTYHLRKQYPAPVSLVATDVNPAMMAIARARVPDPSMNWQTADMQEALPFEDQQFDAVICQFGIMFVPDKSHVFKEILRVLRPGGKFVFNTWDKIESNGVPQIANRVITDFFSNEPPHFYSIPYSMYKPDELKGLALRNGFGSIEVRLVKKVGRSSTALDAARGMVEGNPIYHEIMDKDPKAIGPIVEKITKEITSQFDDHPVICPLQAWVGEATK